MESKKQSFVKGAVILAAAGVIVKILGAVFKIPLANILGDEGSGYYQSAYEWYVWALTLSTYSIPIAVSRLVSEKVELGKRYESHKVFKVSMWLMIVLGAFISGVLFFNTNILVSKNPGAYLAIHYIIPSVLLVSISGAFRGYFQGLQNMTPSAVSQIIEQLGRVVFGFILAYAFLVKGPEAAAGGAAFGTTVGGVLSVLLLVFIYISKRSGIKSEIRTIEHENAESAMSILKRIVIIAIPITIGGSIMPIMNLLDQFIVLDRLQLAGFSYADVVALYGQYKLKVGSVAFMPSVFSISLGASLVPAISESAARKDYKMVAKKTDLGIRVSMIIGLPAACGLYILAEPIMRLLYKTNSEYLALLMRYMAPVVIFLTLVQTLTAILQGIGKERIPVINLAIGAVAKVLLSYFLTSIPYINVKGAIIGTVVGYGIPSILNLIAVIKYQKESLDLIKVFVKPAAASAIMTLVAYFSYKFIYALISSNSLATLSAIMLAGIAYVIALFAVRGITIDELQFAPGGNRLSKALKKRGVK